MPSEPIDPFTLIRRRMEKQGYTGLGDARLRRLDPWLRFTPFVTGILAASGTLMRSPAILTVLAATMLAGMLLPRHPFEVLHNRFIRPLEHSPEIPPTPARRRAAYAVTAALLLAAAGAFWTGEGRCGAVLGWGAAAGMALIAAQQLCLVSQALHRLFGTPGMRED